MKLQPHHFLTPERPKEEEYMFGVGDKPRKLIVDPQFEKDTLEWESLYGEEPEPEWISFEEKDPARPFYWQIDGNGIHPSCHLESMDDLKRFREAHFNDLNVTKWCNKATYDTRLQRWKDHQVKFPGFKKHVYKSTITEFSKTIEDKTVTVCFWADTGETVVSIINDQNEIIFEMTSSDLQVEEVEMIFKNRDIKL